jgi:hypothetical protein
MIAITINFSKLDHIYSTHLVVKRVFLKYKHQIMVTYQKLTILLLRYPIIGYILIGISLTVLSLMFHVETSYCMEEFPDKELAQHRLDNDLLFDIHQEAIIVRLQAIASSHRAPEFFEEVRRIQALVTNNTEHGALASTLNNINEDIPFRERTRGYEAVLIFGSAVIIGYLIINYWEDIFSFLGRTARHAIRETLNHTSILTEQDNVINALNNPQTRGQVLELLNATFQQLHQRAGG